MTDYKPWPWIDAPYYLVLFCGLTVDATLVLLTLKYDIMHDLEWWIVLHPLAVGFFAIFATFTLAVLVWVHIAMRLCRQSCEWEMDREFRLDMLFKTAKICFIGHGYTILLCLALGLLHYKLLYSPELPVVYPLLPLIVLGALYVIMAVMLKSPEINAGCSFFVGVSLLTQCTMLVLKLDKDSEFQNLPWGVTFCPSWFTYGFVFVFCIHCGAKDIVKLLEHEPEESRSSDVAAAAAGNDGSTGSEIVQAPTASADDGLTRRRSRSEVRSELQSVAGAACWALGFGVSQALLTLRFDSVGQAVPWPATMLPAIIGWTMMVLFVANPVAGYFTCVSRMLLDAFGLLSLDDSDDAEAPLLGVSPGLPWR